jgi:hypothetical protein
MAREDAARLHQEAHPGLSAPPQYMRTNSAPDIRFIDSITGARARPGSQTKIVLGFQDFG